MLGNVIVGGELLGHGQADDLAVNRRQGRRGVIHLRVEPKELPAKLVDHVELGLERGGSTLVGRRDLRTDAGRLAELQ